MSNTPQGAELPLAIVDRRLYARRPVSSLAYVDLGDNNGGIILNISAGGLAVTSAVPLDADGVARMRFQLPNSSAWLEVSGEIAWTSQSKRKAGIGFVDISEDASSQIRGWIVSEAPAIEVQPEVIGACEKYWRRLEVPTVRMSQSTPPQPAYPERVTQGHVEVSMPTPNAAPTSFGARTSIAAPAAVVLSPRLLGGTEHKFHVEAEDGPRKILAPKRTWVIVAAVVILGASFLTGWFIGGPEDLILGRFGQTKLETGETANSAASSPASSVASVPGPSVQNEPLHGDEPEPLSGGTANDFRSPPVSNRRAEARSTEPARVSKDTNAVSPPMQIAHQQRQVSKPSSVRTAASVLNPQAENAPPPGPESVGAQTNETSVARPPSPTESSLPPKPAENPEVVTASISVSLSPYPSLRIPAGLESQMSRPGATLQLGQLLSRVDPVYPEEAETQRTEGTVKLHVVIGQNGTIQSVDPRSGPALLVPAAANAVRQWRYTPSSVGGQPVEAEEDITITFRLKQAARPN